MQKKAGNSSVYYASELFDSDKSAVYEKLGLIEQKIAELSSRLFPDDPLILNYERQKQALIAYINEQIVLRLEGEIDIANSKLDALERPGM